MRTYCDNLVATAVTFPSGSLSEVAAVLAVLPDPRPGGGRRVLVVTDVTPFHPLDPLWPDQPADHGTLRTAGGGAAVAVVDAVTAIRRGDGPLLVDDAVDARRAEDGVTFLVAHVVEAAAAPPLPVGAEVTLVVDAVRRRRLSAAHTGCHLLAYALNEVTHELWRKPAVLDSRGHHDLDQVTCVSTGHDLEGSVDRYRLGRSLRRGGFDTARFLDELPGIVARVGRTLAGWVEARAAVRVETAGPLLADRRQWICELPVGTAQMPCGGTHVRTLGEIQSMRPVASWDGDAGILTVRNRVRVRGPA